ncbi:hypothetical protein TNIN_172781 [Trichonephila inaurata madagascariensis]|uniref:Uncharacterized protein n=2 Tax=Trichonephila inaurata madagascariensis TaxID=2747483 RepID=A0A8X6YAG7_9ARAC|nr:hypothetical protein TNIN_172781 [Trichonephila inaurata madagascariensis]
MAPPRCVLLPSYIQPGYMPFVIPRKSILCNYLNVLHPVYRVSRFGYKQELPRLKLNLYLDLSSALRCFIARSSCRAKSSRIMDQFTKAFKSSSSWCQQRGNYKTSFCQRWSGLSFLHILHTLEVCGEIEACLNSRHLTELSPDPTDFNALTPAHFLVGGPIHQFPEPSLPSRSVALSERWNLIQRLRQYFWTSFTRVFT